MAISDVSNLNNLIARGVQAGNQPYSSYDVLSGGTLPDTAKNKIDNLVREALDNTPLDQAAPMELYDQVAEIMIGTTPGMSVETLSNVLQTTGLLNKAKNALPSVNIENELSQITSKYTSKLRNVTGAIDGCTGRIRVTWICPECGKCCYQRNDEHTQWRVKCQRHT